MMLISPLQCCWRFSVHRCMLGLCWHLLRLMVSVVHSLLFVVDMLQSQPISTVLSARFRVLQFDKLRYLAIVIDSEEALSISKVIKLLNWVSAIGVKHISLYDMDGVLKLNKEILLKNLPKVKPWECKLQSSKLEADGTAAHLYPEKMTLELLSSSDGKGVLRKLPAFFSQSCGGPEPDLLVYGPARCHLRFPPWRMRYTEIEHIGTLKSMKHGAIIKAIHKFLRCTKTVVLEVGADHKAIGRGGWNRVTIVQSLHEG